MKIGLYSITYLGVWYRGPALTPVQVIDRARQFGYDGVEIDGKRPHGNPIDMNKEVCGMVRRYAQDSGIEIYAVSGNNDFSSPIPEHRESQLAYMLDLIQMTARLGCKVLRVFAAWPGVTMSDNGGSYATAEKFWHSVHADCTTEQIWDRCRAGLTECARWAGDAGVVLALQNHPPVVDSLETMLRMADEIHSPSLQVCYDAPLARKQGVTAMREAVRKVGSRQVLTHFGGEYHQTEDGSIQSFVRYRDGRIVPEDFYADFTLGLMDIGYDGYTGYELCHPLPKVEGLTVGIDFVDRNARLAAEYMRRVIQTARAALPVAAR